MTDRTLTLGVTTDEATIAKAKKRLQELEQAQQRLAAAQAKFAAEGTKASKAVQDGIEKRSRELTKEQKRLERALQNTNKAFIEQQSAAGRAAKGVETAQAASAGRRGDLSGGSQLTSIGRNIRNLPSVRVPGIGVGTDTFGRAAEVLGKLGVSVSQLAIAAPIAGAALLAVGLAFKNFTDNAKKQADQLNAVVDARRKVGQDIAGGLTTDEADKRVEEINRKRDEEAKLLADLQAQYDNTITSQNALVEGVLKLTPQEEALAKQIEQSKSTIEGYNTEEQALSDAREDGKLAANDAAAAEKTLAQERIQAVLEEANQAGELASLRMRAADLTQEQIDKELESLAIRETGLKAELAALEASGDTSVEVAKKIAELKEQIGFLGEQSDVLKTARKTARSSEADKAAEKAEKDAQKAREKALQDQAKAAEAAAKASQNYNDKLRDIRQSLEDSRADIRRGLRDSIVDANQDLQDDLEEQAIKFRDDQLNEQLQYEHDLAKISRDAHKAETEATRQRDFDAAIQAREDRQTALEERQQQESDDNRQQLLELEQSVSARQRERDRDIRDATIDADRKYRDARINAERQRRDAQINYQDALRDQQQFGKQFTENFRQMYKSVLDMQTQGATSPSRTTRQTQQPVSTSGGDTIGFDDLQYMIASGR